MNFMKLLSGDTEIIKHIDNPEDIVLSAKDLQSEGFHEQDEGCRFEYIFEKGSEGSRVFTKAPRDGAFYVALQVLDTYGTYDEEFIPIPETICGPFSERLVELSVAGKAIGRFRFGGDDRKYYFFVTEEPIQLHEGDEISYKVLAGECAMFTAIVLMKNKPKEQVNSIRNLTAENGEIRFWTRYACRAKVQFGDTVFSEEYYFNNHRFSIPKELWGVRFIIETVDEAGNILRARGTCREHKPVFPENGKLLVPLSYTAVAGDARPAMSVVPVGENTVWTDENILVYDESGNVYPTQTKITSRWQGGSVRTVALEANLPLDGRKFVVKNDAAAETLISDFSVCRERDAVVVTNGKATYRFADESLSVLPDRELIAVLYDENNTRYVAQGATYEIEEQGVNHIVVRRINHFMCGEKQHMKCLTQVHFYRGIEAYRLEFGFENDLMETEFTKINALYLEEAGSFSESVNVYQLDEQTVSENGMERQERFEGVFTVGNAPLIVEDFWQNYPKSVTVTGDVLKIGICPEIMQPERYRDDDINLESRLFFYLKTGKYEFHCGLRKYHSIVFGKDAKKLCDITFLAPDSALVEQSHAFGHIKCDCPDFPSYDEYMENSLGLYMNHREKYREYGMLNYGDSFGEREIHWTNMEYDFPYGMLIHFLRTGDARFYKLSRSAAAHYAEVDTSHRNIHFEEDGYFFIHTVGHANNYYPFEMVPTSFEKIKSHIGHIFAQGLTEYYKVTGIERYKEAVVACADSIAKYYTVKFDFLTEREPGWGMLALQAAYELTLDEYYLNACRIMLERVLEKIDPASRCLKMFMYKTPQEGQGKAEVCYGGKAFMHGIVASAVKYLYQLTGDERAKEASVGFGSWLAEEMFDPQINQFWYTEATKQIQKRHNIPETNIEILDAVLFACLDGHEDYLEIAKKAFDTMLESPYRRECDISKVYSMRLRFAPEIMYYYRKAKEKYEK